MEEAKVSLMDVDGDGASGNNNNNMVQPNQSNEQITKIKLTEMPEEILIHILIHLDSKNLLNVSHVCTLFARIVETAFEKKYTHERYLINGWCSFPLHETILNKYGEKMQKVYLNDVGYNFVDLVEQRCRNIKNIYLRYVPKMIMLTNLKEVTLSRVDNLNRESFVEFINNNQQLESLSLGNTDVDLVDLLDGRANMLKNLKLYSVHEMRSLKFLPAIKLKSLESLTTYVCDDVNYHYTHLIQAMISNQIKNWCLGGNCPNEDDDVIDEICKCKTLTSLDLRWIYISSDQLKELAHHLPDLIKFSMAISNREPTDSMIHSTLSIFPKLKELEIHLDNGDFDRLSIELKRSASDFHARFTKENIKIKLFTHGPKHMDITKDRLIFLQTDILIEVYWMENLDAKHVEEVMNRWRGKEQVKFINNCADQAFDISTLRKVHKGRSSAMESLDFKSNGPISIDSNASLYHIFFPRLKILKIHLVQHGVVDFLQNLNAIFCEQIEELWLNTKCACDDPDIMNIFAKFKNLKSLHLVPSSFKGIVLDELSLVCESLNEIKFIPRDNSEQ